MIKLQNLIYPSTENCTEEMLFFRRYGEVKYSFADTSILLNEEATVAFDTYFNSFSASKWFKYTQIDYVKLKLKLKGKFRISLQYKEKQTSEILQRVVGEFYVDTKSSVQEIDCDFETEYIQGMYAFSILSLEDGSEFYDGCYYTELSEEKIHDVNLGLVICTYKREKYVYRNVSMLSDALLRNPESELKEHLEVVISDNAHTLDKRKFGSDKVHVFENKNAGGSGGFTRGLIECMNLSESKKITHALLMDDDVVIQPESIYRTYKLLTLLKPEYQDSYIGGAMLRTDKQWFQTESGGSWNNGRLVSHKSGLDLRSLDACLYNEFEEKCEFNAWWYCTIPMELVREDNLPLPIFIRGDDVEYGLRNMKRLILMNGICVWHEPFEFKYSSAMYYYIFRNKLIDNAIHRTNYSRKQFVKDFRNEFLREVFTLRYKNAWLLLDGASDFLKGIDWLIQQDGEVLNQKIMEKGYKLQDIDELPIPFSYPEYEQTLRFCESKKQQRKRKMALNGLLLKPVRTAIVPVIGTHIAYLYRVGVALNYDIASHKGFVTYRSRRETLDLLKSYCGMVKKSKRKYSKVVDEYEKRRNEITNVQFWREYLNI